MERLLSRIVRNRVVPFVSRKNSGSFSSSTISTEPPKEPSVSTSSAIINDPPLNTSPVSPSSSSGATSSRRSRGLLKFGVFAAITGTVGTAAYATYALAMIGFSSSSSSSEDSLSDD